MDQPRFFCPPTLLDLSPSGFAQDLRYATRALKRAPGFAAVSILTLARGIAATTIVYFDRRRILLRPLPIHDPDRVMMARETHDGAEGSGRPALIPHCTHRVIRSRHASTRDCDRYRRNNSGGRSRCAIASSGSKS